MKKLSILAFALVAILSAQSAKAWAGFGHAGIVYVAEQHLTPEAKKKCRYYLRHTLPYYASWMDSWRLAEKFRDVNVPHSVMATNDGKGINFSGGKPAGRAMGHLVNALAELGDGKYKNLPDSVVRQRIINMIHYLPDIHCPSHVKFKKPFARSYTQGVTKNGKTIDVHAFWDGSPGIGRKGWELEVYAKNVDKISRKQAKAWQSGSLEDWGRDLAKGAIRRYDLLPDGTEITNMSKAEMEAVTSLADEMAMMAAYRLAHVLNTIFADGNIPVKNK